MRSDLEHLPERQQRELAKVRDTLLAGFDAAKNGGGGGTSTWRRGGMVFKIILFGSYARTDWVDEPENGYLSDFDLLIVVNDEKLTNIADYWWNSEDQILRDPEIGRTVNIIVHDLKEVNDALRRGEYFWTDIVRDGIALYDVPGHSFVAPMPMTSFDALANAETTLKSRLMDLDLRLRSAAEQVAASDQGSHVRKWAAFLLHQGVETAYACFLLVHTFYFPRSHNIRFLRSLAEDIDTRLADAWPREQRADRRRFELLKRAYVEARYSDQYDALAEDLEWLMRRAVVLRDLVANLCEAKVAELRIKAGAR
ncbi:nucleotidyltransferase and HEPN domain-containing protein [Brevundimonas sp. PAMC22021]|uniref:nucleotidyltransferase and HEPN domain-containing protein n=1 Tax=Brevundimonas sp. PAMC22021 TaxID=2861285 RepID=UPI001C6262DB|nr:nucleotidyltransferase and HEPN domain-containing protein [Brevundimonas sp. PAMC22021]QYF86218.1 nucleotidyltransferase and HEPN domain-containing protein [Brevundimonas sp. PAMC22021]